MPPTGGSGRAASRRDWPSADHPAVGRSPSVRRVGAVARELGALVLQTTVAWVVLAGLFAVMIGVTNAPYDGGLTLVGWTFATVVAPIATNVVVVVLGLPLRVVPALRSALRRHGGIPLVVAGAGFCAVLASFVLRVPHTLVLDGIPFATFDLPPGLFWGRWLATAAGLVHATPPFRLGLARAGDDRRPASEGSRSLGA